MGFGIATLAVWGSTAAAVIAAIYLTKNPYCLWAMIIPLFVNIRTGKDAGKEDDE